MTLQRISPMKLHIFTKALVIWSRVPETTLPETTLSGERLYVKTVSLQADPFLETEQLPYLLWGRSYCSLCLYSIDLKSTLFSLERAQLH